MRRPLGVLLAVSLLALAACTSDDRTPFEGFRDLQAGSVIAYRVQVAQRRTAAGLGDPKTLVSSVRIDLEEETTDDATATLVVRGATGRGEPSQARAAQRLAGRRVAVDLDDETTIGPDALSGADDVAATDIGMLFTLLAPVIGSPQADAGDRWRVVPDPIAVSWSRTPLALTVTHEVLRRERFADLDAVRVKSVALGNVAFRLPIVAPAPRAPGATGSSDELIVNRLFEELFADVDDPVEGVAAAIAAIPLAVAAPFLAIGEALGNLFGGGPDEPDAPEIPAVDLTGPIELRSDTRVWDADGRVLDALGNGTMRLTGRVPELPGAAGDLTGKTLTMDVVWKLHRVHSSAFPADRDPPGRGPVPVYAVVLLVIAAGLAAARHLAARPRNRRPADGG